MHRFMLIILLTVVAVTSIIKAHQQYQSHKIVQSISAQTPRADWPQYQHDENRTGYNPITNTDTSYIKQWEVWFENDSIANTAQPISIDQTLFIGTKTGKVVALDKRTGKIAWQTQLDGAINHTLAATSSQVFAATLKGHVYAFNIDNGFIDWEYHAAPPASFGGAILLVESNQAIYVANRRGFIYALNIDSGNIIWESPFLGNFISQSPTYGDGKIFIGTEDMKLHALDASNGRLIWSTEQLNGVSFGNYAPVFAQGKIITTISPNLDAFVYESDHSLFDRANMDALYAINNPTDTRGGDPFSTTELQNAMRSTREWLSLHPQSQTFYVFDSATGQQPYLPSVLHTIVNGGPQPPPIYIDDGSEQKLITMFHVTGSMWTGCRYYCSMFNLIPWGAMGVLDLNTGLITKRYTSKNIFTRESPGEITVDETNNYSAAGAIIFGARCQTSPSCSMPDSEEASCRTYGAIEQPFPDDTCQPDSSPIFTNGHLIHMTQDVIAAYQ